MSSPSSQAAQAGLVISMADELRPVLPTVDYSTQWDQAVAFLYQLVHRYGAASAALAARQYLAARHTAGISSPFRPRPAPLPPLDQVARTLGWATSPLSQPGQEDQVAHRVTLATERMVLDVGRQTIVDNALRDSKAKGWARLTEPSPCAFCAMLATRGAVYRSEHSAEFQTHDHCRCHAAPVFNAYESSAQVREWQGLYREATAGVSGMKATQKAWRQAFDSKYHP